MAAAALSLAPTFTRAAEIRQSEPPPANPVEQLLRVEVPVVLCIDDKPGVGGQPSGQAYAQAAASGYRSILTLRNNKDGVDLLRERSMIERHKMRYFNIPVAPNTPSNAQADQFLALTRDKNNHPMLINCAFAERVAPLMLIFRIVEQGWSEEKAVDEAARMGLPRDSMKKFARTYFAQKKN